MNSKSTFLVFLLVVIAPIANIISILLHGTFFRILFDLIYEPKKNDGVKKRDLMKTK